MKRQNLDDDRQRAIHLLARSVPTEDHGGEGFSDHLLVDDLIGLVSGTLFKTECARIENHLLSCERCAETTRRLHLEYEAGVVPILLRRAPTDPAPDALAPRAPRRWAPLVLALLAFGVVVTWRSSLSDLLLAPNETRVDDAWLVVERVGDPVVRGLPSVNDVAEAGRWLLPGETLILEAGDRVVVQTRNGVLTAISAAGRADATEPSGLFTSVFDGSAEDREELAREALRPVSEPPESGLRPRVIHPRGPIHERRPVIRWSDPSDDDVVIVRLREPTAAKPLFERRVEGRSLRFPSDVPSLVPGGQYRLELLSPADPRRPVAVEPFQLLESASLDLVELRLDAIARAVGPGPHLVRAEYLRQAGLYGAAREELERLRVGDSGNLRLLALLKVVYARLGLRREEERAFKSLTKRSG